MSNTASNFLTTPFPQEEEIYGVVTATNVIGEIQSGFRATVRVSQSVKGSIGNAVEEVAKIPSQAIKGEIGSQIREQVAVNHQGVFGRIGTSVIGVSSSEGRVVTVGSLHTSIVPYVVISVEVNGSIGNRLSETVITSDKVEGSINDSLVGKGSSGLSVTGNIGTSIKERHYTPMNKNITVKVL